MTSTPDEDRPVDEREVEADPGPRRDEEDRPTAEEVVGLAVDSDDREVAEPNEPA